MHKFAQKSQHKKRQANRRVKIGDLLLLLDCDEAIYHADYQIPFGVFLGLKDNQPLLYWIDDDAVITYGFVLHDFCIMDDLVLQDLA